MEKQIVADSTALVLLAKSGLLDVAVRVFDIAVPTSVADEAASVRLAGKHPDAAAIRDLIQAGKIRLAEPGRTRHRSPMTLHRGERDALAFALDTPGCVFATDDGRAIKAARFMKMPFVITPRIAVELFRLGELGIEKARLAIEKMGKVGRYSPEIIAEAILSLTEVRNGKADDHKNI